MKGFVCRVCTTKRVFPCLPVFALAVLGVGCASPDGGPGGAAAAAGLKPPTIEQQIQKVESDTRMPPQAKQKLIDDMKASYTNRGQAVPQSLLDAERKQGTKTP